MSTTSLKFDGIAVTAAKNDVWHVEADGRAASARFLDEAIAAAGAGEAVATGVPSATGVVTQPRVSSEHEKLGRNDPCWCGSGKKFKKCHGA